MLGLKQQINVRSGGMGTRYIFLPPEPSRFRNEEFLTLAAEI